MLNKQEIKDAIKHFDLNIKKTELLQAKLIEK